MRSVSPPVLVLLSLGRHPVSGRARRAVLDARALTLALQTGLPVIGVHAGSPDAVLRDYIGMGLTQLVTLDVADGGDPAALLAAYARDLAPALILAGCTAETGQGSGLVPYLVAEALGLALAPGIAAIEARAGGFDLIQALPRGGRRALRVSGPMIATVDQHGPQPGQVARGPALRGQLRTARVSSIASVANLEPAPDTMRAARQRPKRLASISDQPTGTGRRLLAAPSPQEAATAILEYLEAERLLTRQTKAHPRAPEKAR